MALEQEAVASDPNPEAASASEIDVTIRRAVPEDANDIARLSQELLAFYGLPVPNQRSYMAHLIAGKAFGENPSIEILMAHDGPRPIGFLAFSESFAVANCTSFVFIQDLFVIRRARRAGVGRKLMGELALICEARQIGQLDWTTDPWNSKARTFYEELGPLLNSEKIYYRMLGPKIAAFARHFAREQEAHPSSGTTTG